MAANGEPIGNYEMYSSETGHEAGIDAAKRIALDAPIETEV
jgi:uncharacterized protein YegP (UPF0339 family)